MSETYGDLVARALHADAEAARAEIRAAGLICPSCDVNMADLPDGHVLTLSTEEPWTAKCAGGTLATLTGISSPMSDDEFGEWQAAANIALWDAFRRREEEAFKRIVGEGPAQFTGLLDVLEAGEES
jgi:hypothetical protein